jgi:hypothetical protein
MAYATLEDLRSEGFSAEDIPDARAQRALDDASALIDAVTGQFFEPRQLSIVLEGRGAASLWLPVPVIRVDRLLVDGNPWSSDLAGLVIVGAPVVRGLDGPRITRRYGVFPRGASTVIEGLWGYTEPNGSTVGRTPLAIRRACLLMVTRLAPPLADDASVEARQQPQIIEERTRDQSFRLAAPPERAPFLVGDAEVDALLWPFVRPPSMGAV